MVRASLRNAFSAAAALAVLVLLAYIPAVQGDFIWDDDSYVTENETLRSADGLRRIWFEPLATPQYYPLVHTTYWIEYHLWGLDPLGYHLVNVLLHAACAILLWRVLRRLSVPGAWFAAAIFALHPVHVESVAWITERKNVLSGVLYMAALLAYLHFARLETDEEPAPRDGRFYALSLGLFVAALFSKTVTFSLPAAIVLLVWWKKGRLTRRDILPVLPMVPLGVAFGAFTVWMETHHVGTQLYEWDLSFVDRCLIAGRALWFYAAKLLVPYELLFFYPRWEIDSTVWWQYLFPAGAIVVVSALWLSRERIGRGPLVALLFFCGTLSPALGFVNVYPMRFSFVADHFQYLASIGLTTLFAAGLWAWLERWGGPSSPRSTGLGAALRYGTPLLVLLVLASLTWRQGWVYADLETLWRRTLATNPSAWLAQYNLANLLSGEGDPEQAIVHYRKAIELRPDYFEAHHNVGLQLLKLERDEEALTHLNESLRIRPEQPQVHNTLGVELLENGRTAEAVQRFRVALRHDPGYWRAYVNLGLAEETQGRSAQAASYYSRALEIEPNDADTRVRYGTLLARQGSFDEAIVELRRALSIAPDLVDAHTALGLTLAARGELDAGVAELRQALRLDPDDPSAREALARLGRDGEP